MSLAPRLLFAVQLLSTLAMFGIIWFVQLVHYPMFPDIDPGNFTHYEAAYANRMGLLVGPLMLAELVSAALLLFPALRPPEATVAEVWVGLLLLGLIWASTALIQIPLHNRLHIAPDPAAMRRLVATNWIRTVGWTARAALVLVWVDRLGRRL